jgi:NAD(P)-dependent dehydrogenase (short-subunit alcohol dehydrogenase family)
MASNPQPRRLAGRAAIITGAAGDIGIAIAARYALEGARVLCLDIDLAGAERCAAAVTSQGGTAVARRCDVADARSANDSVRIVEQTFGRIDILVNNAAAPTPIAPLHELDEKDWQLSLDVNLTGAFLMSKAALPSMLRARSGCIIHVASQMGHVGAPGRAAYGATKAALIQLARVMALDYGTHGIRVNSLSPGAVLTSRLTSRYGSAEATRAELEPKYPLGRIGAAHEIAAAAAFLASDEAAFMTGSDLLVDGGYTAQ